MRKFLWAKKKPVLLLFRREVFPGRDNSYGKIKNNKYNYVLKHIVQIIHVEANEEKSQFWVSKSWNES